MTTGVVAHLFWRGKVLLVLRDKGEGFADPDCWDSVTETLEDGEDFFICLTRGLVEEIGVSPAEITFLGVTRRGHGFFYGTLTDTERKAIILGQEGQKLGFFTLDEARGLQLGGALRNHLEAYPDVFEKMSRGIAPEPHELGLRVLLLK